MKRRVQQNGTLAGGHLRGRAVRGGDGLDERGDLGGRSGDALVVVVEEAGLGLLSEPAGLWRADNPR